MGAHKFTHFVKVSEQDPTPQAAYDRLHDEACWMDGSSGYSGTIATTHGLANPGLPPMSLTSADVAAYSADTEKWGAAQYVTVLDDACVTTRTVTVTVPMPTERLMLRTEEEMEQFTTELVKKALDQVTPNNGEHIATYRVDWHNVQRGVTPTFTEAPHTGTLYRLVVDGGVGHKWNRPYPTMKAAKEAAVEMLAYDGRNRVVTIEESLALEQVTVEFGGVAYSVEVFLDTVTGDTVAGWLIYGTAAS